MARMTSRNKFLKKLPVAFAAFAVIATGKATGFAACVDNQSSPPRNPPAVPRNMRSPNLLPERNTHRALRKAIIITTITITIIFRRDTKVDRCGRE